MNDPYPVRLAVDYPDRPLNRLTTAFRLLTIIPIAIVIGAIGGGSGTAGSGTGSSHATTVVAGGTGLLVVPVLLMIVVRQKYPRWWFEFNRELLRFSYRVCSYGALMDDHYPSTDEEQAVHLELPYPDVPHELNRWLPLVKWLLALPHYVVLFFLTIGAVLAVVLAWAAILVTGRYPRGLFEYIEGVLRWWLRVVGYAFALVTDEYPPFRFAA